MTGLADATSPNELYKVLKKFYGPSRWWPGESPFEVIVGAVLTQNTAWSNVEKTIKNLKDKDKLDIDSILLMKEEALASLIRPSGYYNIKAKRLKNLVKYIHTESGNNLDGFLSKSSTDLRNSLLAVNGIGKETADSICCYAADKSIFVVDAYTKRVLSRHGIADESWDYDRLQKFFENGLPKNIGVYKNLHAYFVFIGKDFCKKKNPICSACPLGGLDS